MTIKDYCEKAISRHSDNGPSQNLGLLGERTVLSSDQRIFVLKGIAVLSREIPYRGTTE
ncbi:MAG: hypothetical protein H7A28_03650 [Thermotogae bacterium]|nr:MULTISPECIES: hypothetical protein [Mesotoga]MCP5457430.1 hypothetical protein [Thermotogota bacterium]MCP5460796.1 hypothetical protein [Thermotogota bacterium]CCU83632.1 hypothetical protein PHOSAC3_120246 [Mesotoga infera]HNQ71652.1 hypothetical protein [Mesotoga prima]